MGLEGPSEINQNSEGKSTSSSGSSMTLTIAMDGIPVQFPAGLRVLVVDDDPVCLKVLDRMLRSCFYEVTTCSKSTVALSMLREKKDSFDLVITDVYMPDMDGFKLLELIGLEMGLPVIMMSADGATSVVMKGITHGACDYLLKPVRIEALRTIWQHVIRKKHNESREIEHSGSVEDCDRHRKGSEELEYASSINEGNSVLWKSSKKRKDSKDDEEEGDQENEDSSTLKKPRVVWSVELHQQFVHAVNQLGIDKAVPKRILEIMNVQGLTRENVASHLQKYRLYLKRIGGGGQQQNGFNSSFGVSDVNFGSISSLDRQDFQALASSSQMARESLSTFQGGSQIDGSEVTLATDMAFILQPELQGLSCSLSERLKYGQQSLISDKIPLQAFPPSGIDMKHLNSPYQNLPSPSFGRADFGPGFPLPQHLLPSATVPLSRTFNQFGIPLGNSNNNNNGPIGQIMLPQNQRPLFPQISPPLTPSPHSLHRHITANNPLGPQPKIDTEGIADGIQILSIPPINALNSQIFSGDGIGTIPISSALPLTNGLSALNSVQINHIPPTSVPQSDGRVSADFQNQNMGGAISGTSYGHSRNPATHLPPMLSMGNCGDMNLAAKTACRMPPEIMESQSLNNPASSYGAEASNGYAHGGGLIYSHQKQNWHGSAVSQSNNDSVGGAAELQSLHDVGISGLVIEGQAGDSNPETKVDCQQLVGNPLSVKEEGGGASSLMATSDLETRFHEPQFDDIMSVLKQQQEEDEGFSEGEFGADVYQLDAAQLK